MWGVGANALNALNAVPGGDPPQSSLVSAFGRDVDTASDAIVIRGFSGRSTMATRALEFIRIGRDTGEQDDLTPYEDAVGDLAAPAEKYILRIYLTPRLNTYVDFQRSCLIGWRYETQPELQDMITVWLYAYDLKGRRIPYRVIEETKLGPSSSAFVGGSILDDYLNQPLSQSSAWGTQSALYGGGGKYTTPHCS